MLQQSSPSLRNIALRAYSLVMYYYLNRFSVTGLCLRMRDTFDKRRPSAEARSRNSYGTGSLDWRSTGTVEACANTMFGA
jgi:hypothetical protein